MSHGAAAETFRSSILSIRADGRRAVRTDRAALRGDPPARRDRPVSGPDVARRMLLSGDGRGDGDVGVACRGAADAGSKDVDGAAWLRRGRKWDMDDESLAELGVAAGSADGRRGRCRQFAPCGASGEVTGGCCGSMSRKGVPALLLFFFFGGGGVVDEVRQLGVPGGGGALSGGGGVSCCLDALSAAAGGTLWGDCPGAASEVAVAGPASGEWLYRNIFAWYLLPIALGWGMMVYVMMLRDGPSLPRGRLYRAFAGVLRLGLLAQSAGGDESLHAPSAGVGRGCWRPLDAVPPDGPVR